MLKFKVNILKKLKEKMCKELKIMEILSKHINLKVDQYPIQRMERKRKKFMRINGASEICNARSSFPALP